MNFSYSKIKTFETCPYKFKLKYVDRLETIPDNSPDSPLIIGTACHHGVEVGSVEEAIKEYKSNFTITNYLHDLEMYKLEKVVGLALEQIPRGEYEVKLSCEDGFTGYIDCLVPVGDGVYDLYDFKYSNRINSYKRSGQVHIYKYYFEKLMGKKIRDLYYVFFPKCSTPDYSYSLEELKTFVDQFYSDKKINFEKVYYDINQVQFFFSKKNQAETATSFEKKPSTACKFCDYYKYCMTNGQDMSEILVKTEVNPEQTYQPESLF